MDNSEGDCDGDQGGGGGGGNPACVICLTSVKSDFQRSGDTRGRGRSGGVEVDNPTKDVLSQFCEEVLIIPKPMMAAGGSLSVCSSCSENMHTAMDTKKRMNVVEDRVGRLQLRVVESVKELKIYGDLLGFQLGKLQNSVKESDGKLLKKKMDGVREKKRKAVAAKKGRGRPPRSQAQGKGKDGEAEEDVFMLVRERISNVTGNLHRFTNELTQNVSCDGNATPPPKPTRITVKIVKNNAKKSGNENNIDKNQNPGGNAKAVGADLGDKGGFGDADYNDDDTEESDGSDYGEGKSDESDEDMDEDEDDDEDVESDVVEEEEIPVKRIKLESVVLSDDGTAHKEVDSCPGEEGRKGPVEDGKGEPSTSTSAKSQYPPEKFDVDFTGMTNFKKFILRKFLSWRNYSVSEELKEYDGEIGVISTESYLRKVKSDWKSAPIKYLEASGTLQFQDVKIQINEEDKKLRCSQCSLCTVNVKWPPLNGKQGFEAKRRFKRHIFFYHSKVLKCRVCDLKCMSPQDYREHLETHTKGELKVPKKPSQVPRCSSVYARFSCGIETCRKMFDTRFERDRHLWNHKTKEEKALEVYEDKYQILCMDCGKTIDKRYLKMHKELSCVPEEVPSFACPHCEKTFKSRNCMLNHAEIFHTGPIEPGGYKDTRLLLSQLEKFY